MTAQILDGKATAAAIKADLKQRVAKLKELGVTPGLGTVLIGEDPGSQSYVAGKHRDCEQVGIASIRAHYPADIDQAFLEDRIRELNEDPACTGFIVQLPLPKHLDTNRAIELVDPAKDADGLHPTNLGRLVHMTDAAAAVHAARHRRAAAHVRRRRSTAPRSAWSAGASPSVGRSGCCSPGAPRTRR